MNTKDMITKIRVLAIELSAEMRTLNIALPSMDNPDSTDRRNLALTASDARQVVEDFHAIRLQYEQRDRERRSPDAVDRGRAQGVTA